MPLVIVHVLITLKVYLLLFSLLDFFILRVCVCVCGFFIFFSLERRKVIAGNFIFLFLPMKCFKNCRIVVLCSMQREEKVI